MKRLSLLFPALLLAAACGDDAGGGDDTPDDPDAAVDPDAEEEDPDAPPDYPEPTVVALSESGTEALYSATWGADGKLYAVGFAAPATDSGSDRSIVVARFDADGALDTTFGTEGVASINAAPGGRNGELARGITVLADGKIVLSGTIEHDVAATGAAANDRDIVIVRLDADGTPDETFGGGDGIVVHDITTGAIVTDGMGNETLAGADFVWGIAAYPDDKLVVHGATRADGRNDTDWLLLRLNADGSLDDTFSDDGKFTLDLEQVNASARGMSILDDGSILGYGYANTPSQASLQPVVYKVTPAGALDPDFGNGGVFHDAVLAAAAEAYGGAIHDGEIVTIGYGRTTSAAANDWVSIRLTADGELDPSWDGDGVMTVDVAGYSDQGRFALALPDGQTLFAGSGRTAEDDADAMVGIFDATGQPVTAFGPEGRRMHDLGGPSDVFWGAALSPDGSTIALVGAKGMGNSATATDNDDAALLLLPVE